MLTVALMAIGSVTGAYASDSAALDTPEDAISFLESQPIEGLDPIDDSVVIVTPPNTTEGAILTVDASLSAVPAPGVDTKDVVLDPGAIVTIADSTAVTAVSPDGAVIIGVDGLRSESVVRDPSGVIAGDINNGGTLVALRPTSSGIQIVSVIPNNSASEEYEYPLGIPTGAQIYETDNGAYVFEAADQSGLGKIESPWAVDALGASVPTHFKLRGTTLVQIVEHHTNIFQYPITADPQWSYTHTAIARTGNGAIVSGSETAARAMIELRRCFNCSFPVSGAPRVYPSNYQILNLNASPFSFINIPAPVRFYKTGPSTEPDWYFIAQTGHFDGAGSRINFDFYKPSGYPVRIAISATIVKDNGYAQNSTNSYVAKTVWNTFITNLILNIRRN